MNWIYQFLIFINLLLIPNLLSEVVLILILFMLYKSYILYLKKLLIPIKKMLYFLLYYKSM